MDPPLFFSLPLPVKFMPPYKKEGKVKYFRNLKRQMSPKGENLIIPIQNQLSMLRMAKFQLEFLCFGDFNLSRILKSSNSHLENTQSVFHLNSSFLTPRLKEYQPVINQASSKYKH